MSGVVGAGTGDPTSLLVKVLSAAAVLALVVKITMDRARRLSSLLNFYERGGLRRGVLRAWVLALPVSTIAVTVIGIGLVVLMELNDPSDGVAISVSGVVVSDALLRTVGDWAVGVAVVLVVLTLLEPAVRWDVAKHWLGSYNLERRHAERVKRGEKWMFKIDESSCASVAGFMGEHLAGEPDYLEGMLLRKLDRDPDTLANELIVGEVFEARDREHTSYNWSGIVAMQDVEMNGKPVLAPGNVCHLRADVVWQALATKIEEVHKWIPSAYTRDGVLDVLEELRGRYKGHGLRVLTVPKLSRSDLKWWKARDYTDWLRIQLRLTSGFETVVSRVRRLPVYRDRPVAPLALAKFAFEFDLLNCDPRELSLGQSWSIVLMLLNSGAVRVSGDDDGGLSVRDSDLGYFCDQAMRRIAKRLHGVLVEKAVYPEQALVRGERYPYNIVDGFLYVAGHDEELRRDDSVLGVPKARVSGRYAFDSDAQVFRRHAA